MRSAEVDVLTLGEFGVSMFDAKQAIWDDKEFTDPRSATQMAQYIVIREQEKRWIVNSTSPFDHPKVIHMTRLADGRDVIKSPNRSQETDEAQSQSSKNDYRGRTSKQGGEKNIQYKTGVDAKTLKQFFPELFNENPTKAEGSKKRKRLIQVDENDTTEDAIRKIGKALVEGIKTPRSTWGKAASIINRVISQEEKVRLFGSKKFTLAKAKLHLCDYVVISNEGTEVVVRPKNSSKNTNTNTE